MIRRLKRYFAQCLVFVGVMMTCAGVVCTDQVLPQLVAHLASLDSDHHVVMRAGSQGIDLLLLHESSAATLPQQTQTVIGSTSPEPTHTIHFSNGTIQTSQAVTGLTSIKLQVARYIVATVSMKLDVFVPKELLLDSRPPPQRTVISFNRSTLLLI